MQIVCLKRFMLHASLGIICMRMIVFGVHHQVEYMGQQLIIIQVVLQVVTYRPVTVLVTQRVRERMRGTVITVNKKIRRMPDFCLAFAGFVLFLFFDRHGGQWTRHHAPNPDFFTRYNTVSICAVCNTIQGGVNLL